MKIKSLQIRITNIPFVVVFKHFLKSRSEVEGIIVELTLDSGVKGYGEALPRDYVTGETTESVVSNLTERVFPVLEGAEFSSFDELKIWIENFDQNITGLGEKDLCVRTATELALLDAFGKENNVSVIDLLGTPKTDVVTYSGIVSAEGTEGIKKVVSQYKAMQINQIKMKVGKDLKLDLENVALTRELMGDDAQIRIDGNEAWNLAEAKSHLDEFVKLNVFSVEQPMPAKNREDYPALMEYLKGRMHISLDESLCSESDALWMAKNKGASLFNLRVSKNGGIINTLKLYKIAKDGGLNAQLGAQVGETSILSSAGRIVAALTGDLFFCEGSYGKHLLSFDLTQDPLVFGPEGKGNIDYLRKLPGLGIEVDTELLSKMTIRLI